MPSYEPYHFHLQEDAKAYFSAVDLANRRMLLIVGHGFDPRCTSALRNLTGVLRQTRQPAVYCSRFRNLLDPARRPNEAIARKRLATLRNYMAALAGNGGESHECLVDLFDPDGRVVGADMLVERFMETFSDRLGDFTDILIDISAFPRSMMFPLVSYLLRQRRPRQNICALLSVTRDVVRIEESDFREAYFIDIRGDGEPDIRRHGSGVIWMPVLGGDVERLDRIHEFLSPATVLPILPFPSTNPRLADEVLLKGRDILTNKWRIDLERVMYAADDGPFDVFRKIVDVAGAYQRDMPRQPIVVSILSGRSLSLGVLLAARELGLGICHVQPTTYVVTAGDLDRLETGSKYATTTLYMLAGDAYEYEESDAQM